MAACLSCEQEDAGIVTGVVIVNFVVRIMIGKIWVARSLQLTPDMLNHEIPIGGQLSITFEHGLNEQSLWLNCTVG